ncbi:MAG: TonB-dependent receptor [Flavobacteriales bacterium]|nr:TonB-dependent receptor [Flavobacteriales bacterium]
MSIPGTPPLKTAPCLWRCLLSTLVLCIGSISMLQAQQAPSIAGTVTDAATGESLPGAVVMLAGKTVSTNIEGAFSLSLNPNEGGTLRVRYVGYLEWTEKLEPWTGNLTRNVSLSPDVARIGTAVISAGRYEQDLGEVSVSIDVLPPELVNQGAPTSADQSLSRTPGVTIVDSEPQIRGGSGYSFGAGSRVAVLLDGLPVLSGDAGRPTWGFLPLENLEQVEVVKGASSVLYGSSALSGVIQFRTAFPDPEPLTRVTVQHGVHSNPGNGRKYWNSPLMQSSTSWLHTRRLKNGDGISFGGQWLGSDGHKGPQIDPVTGQPHDRPYNPFTVDHYDAERQWRVNGAWEHTPKNGGWGYGLRANAISGEGVNTLLWLDADTGFYAATPGADTRTVQRMITVDPHFERTVGNWNHRIQGRFLRLVNDNDNDQGNASNTWQSEYRSRYRAENWSATAGLYAQGTRSIAELYDAGIGDTVHDAANRAAYLQIDAQPHERLHLTAGTRYEHFELDSVSLGKTVFRTGINYRFGQASFLRASIGQGFRFPSIAEKFIRTTVGGISVFPSLDIRPESSINMEVGLKQGFRFGQKGQWKGFFDVAIFQQDFEDFIEYTFGIWGNTGNGLLDLGFRSINTGKARVNGLEWSTMGTGEVGQWKVQWLIGQTLLDPVSMTPDSVYATFSGGSTMGVSYNSTSSDTTDNVLKYRILNTFRTNLSLQHASGWTVGWNAARNTTIQNIDKAFLDIEELGLLEYGLIDWLAERPNVQWLHDFQVGRKFNDQHHVELIVRNAANLNYALRPLAAEANRLWLVRYTFTP